MDYVNVKIPREVWQEFVVRYLDQCWTQPGEPMIHVLESLLNSRDECTQALLRGLMCAAWAELADFAAAHPEPTPAGENILDNSHA